MMKASSIRCALAGSLVLVSMAAACGTDSPPPAEKDPAGVLSAELLATTWQVRMARDEARAPFESASGWALHFQREQGQALQAFASSGEAGARGLARSHAELAAFYRQAALLGARAARHTFGEARVDEDPLEVHYLLAVDAAFAGKPDEARAALASLPPDAAAEVVKAAAAWQSWLDAGAVWPPDAALAGLAGPGVQVMAGQNPDGGPHPQFRLTERSAEARTVELGDPTQLYLLSRAHEAAAKAAVPADAAVIDLFLAPWSLPAEAGPATELAIPVDDSWIFAGFALSGADLVFLADASTAGVPAVQRHLASSPLAAVVAPAIVDGQVVPDKMLDQAAWLGQQVEAAMREAGGGEQSFHPPFARLASVAALRAAMIVADANDQYRDAGVLRVNALDRSVEGAADPVFLISVAAWDAGNRNALRAQELVHRLHRRYPALQAARYSLDFLHIRTSRNAAPAAPVH
mgnify:CR=1 FL=1